ncbi:Uncharacterised protein [Mycobacteroides abscessus subsp. abscessus]|nr:Uncharacterised protein [Mycobacteroides abscessus subsp. abscessus]
MVPLSLLDGLLNLDLRVCVLVDLRVEQCHQVLPRLDEWVSHEIDPPSAWMPVVVATYDCVGPNLSVACRSPHPLPDAKQCDRHSS